MDYRMSPAIPAEFVPFVTRELASGKYGSEAEVVAAALRLLEERERKLDGLRADIQLGVDQLERGEGIVLADDAALGAFFDEIKVRSRERLEGKNQGA
jgi:antitoxin ParD1/3/4